jgi:hypothetical protein
MLHEEEALQVCSECGASIYPEHLSNNVAAQAGGQLLCPYCLRAKRTAGAAVATGVGAARGGSSAGMPAIEAERPITMSAPDAPIEYEQKTVIRQSQTMSERVGGAAYQFKNPLVEGHEATRCRVFHGKLADAAFGHLADQINEWVDNNRGVRLKFATSCIGVVEGKHHDAHLIVTVFY